MRRVYDYLESPAVERLWSPRSSRRVTFVLGMNAAVRAIVRMGIYLGCKVYFIHEVRGWN